MWRISLVSGSSISKKIFNFTQDSHCLGSCNIKESIRICLATIIRLAKALSTHRSRQLSNTLSKTPKYKKTAELHIQMKMLSMPWTHFKNLISYVTDPICFGILLWMILDFVGCFSENRSQRIWQSIRISVNEEYVTISPKAKSIHFQLLFL